MKVVCTEKTLTINFKKGKFPNKLCSFEGHDALEIILVSKIPEINGDGLEGGFYGQCLTISITIEAEDMGLARETEIYEIFAAETKRFCRRGGTK